MNEKEGFEIILKRCKHEVCNSKNNQYGQNQCDD